MNARLKRWFIILILLVPILMAAVYYFDLRSILDPRFRFVPDGKHVYIHFMSVGQADAILLLFPDGSTALIDAAEKNDERRVRRYFNRLGIKRINTAFITHAHGNHIGTYPDMFQRIKMDRFFFNGVLREEKPFFEAIKLINLIESKRIPLHIVGRGDVIDQLPEGIQLKVLSPDEETAKMEANEGSLVMWFTYGDFKFLFTGDLQEEQFAKLVQSFPFVRSADFVQIGHHGNSIDDAFLQTFPNSYFVASRDIHKRITPEEKILEKARKKLYRTDQDGNIMIKSDGKKFEVFTQQ